MSTAMYKEYTLTSNGVWNALRELVKANAPAFASKGEPLRIIVTSEERKRNNLANRYYWGAVLRNIAEQAWVNSQQYSADVWHEHYARKFGVCEDVTLPSGEVIVRRKSTADMSEKEFSEYTTRIQADAAQTLGVEFV
jgi:hypothetical protein